MEKKKSRLGNTRNKTPVLVDEATLERAAALTGIADPTQLVEFSLGLLTQPDPSATFAREKRGSLPDLELDV